jgi:hypothetical protein
MADVAAAREAHAKLTSEIAEVRGAGGRVQDAIAAAADGEAAQQKERAWADRDAELVELHTTGAWPCLTERP